MMDYISMMYFFMLAYMLGIIHCEDPRIHVTTTRGPPEQKEQHHDVIIMPSEQDEVDQAGDQKIKSDQDIKTQKTKIFIAGCIILAIVLVVVVPLLCFCCFTNPKINFPDGLTLPTYV